VTVKGPATGPRPAHHSQVVSDAAAALPIDADTVWLDRWHQGGRACLADEQTVGLQVTLAVAQSCLPPSQIPPGASAATVPKTRSTVTNLAPIPLVVAASNSIRHLDLLGGILPVDLEVFSSRGLAGIDGTIATAMGLAHARSTPVRALVGDLAFLHDASSLGVGAHEVTPDLDVIILNDSGGGIFRTLEHAQVTERTAFERYFLTPQTASIGHIAAAYQAEYVLADDLAALRTALLRPPKGLRVLEFNL
jgi:2-succinyl-5-enolpyruvyl-6-hydroxy-3-cyclohexene-1-carboxylate synthase